MGNAFLTTPKAKKVCSENSTNYYEKHVTSRDERVNTFGESYLHVPRVTYTSPPVSGLVASTSDVLIRRPPLPTPTLRVFGSTLRAGVRGFNTKPSLRDDSRRWKCTWQSSHVGINR